MFTPYSDGILGNLIFDKLEELRQRFHINLTISEKLLKFLTKKLENQTKGDLRMVNEFLKELVADIVVYNN